MDFQILVSGIGSNYNPAMAERVGLAARGARFVSLALDLPAGAPSSVALLPTSNPGSHPTQSAKVSVYLVWPGNGGEGGIRTHDTVSGIPVFETGAFDQLCHLSPTKNFTR